MDFSVSGSDSWETTPFQETFIESYFQEQKFPVSSTSSNTRKKRKSSQDVNLVEDNQCYQTKKKSSKLPIKEISSQDVNLGDNQHYQKKKKSLKLPIEEISPQSSKMDSMIKIFQHPLKKKLKKRIKDIPESTEKESHEDFERGSINGDFQCTENKSSQKPKNLEKHLIAPIKSKLKKRLEKKLKKTASWETESLLLEPNTLPLKQKSLKKKVTQSLKETLELSKNLQDSEKNPEDAFQESDEELVSEIRNSDVFKEIKELINQEPFLSNLKDSEESFGELSGEDSDESSPDESSPEVTNSILLKTVKATKNVKKNTKLPANESQKLFSKGKTCNADAKKCVPDQASNMDEGCKLQNDDKPLIRNLLNSKKNSVASSLRSKAQEKLQAAKFRYLNEKLYTETGENAFQYFQENVDEFHDYHQGYSLQVSKWPMNPVSKIISDIQSLKKNTVIADMGCGDAKIARTLNKLTVHSFDIVALNEFVTPCDISKVPLPNESVDVVVFCLSLMGINLKEYLLEAHRILKMGGALKIAEVESRITDVNIFIKGLKCLGFSLDKQDLKHKIFVFLDLKKEKKRLKSAKIPNITLRPCLYKKR